MWLPTMRLRVFQQPNRLFLRFKSTATATKKVPKPPRQNMQWMPNMTMMLVSARSANADHRAYATFRVEPRMTKHEIKEYLTKIYQLPVEKVHTMNYLGKRKRLATRRGMIYYKYKNFKKAVVYFQDSLTDVGMGTRVPELEESVEGNS